MTVVTGVQTCALPISFPGFAELKRSLREKPRLRSLGFRPDQDAGVEDWRDGAVRS